MKVGSFTFHWIAAVLLMSTPLSTRAQSDAVIHFTNGHFQKRDGSLFAPLGGFYGNEIPEIRNNQLVTEEDWHFLCKRSLHKVPETEWRRWFAVLRDKGCNTIRLFNRLHDILHDEKGDHPVDWHLDAGGHVDHQVWSVFDRYMTVGEEYGLHFIMVVLDEPRNSIYTHWAPYLQAVTQYQRYGWAWNRFVPKNVGDRQLLPTEDDYLTDKEAVSLQQQYLAEILPLLRAHPSLIAVELANEQGWNGSFLWRRQNSEIAWSREMVRTIKRLAPGLPVCFSLSHGVTAMDPVAWGKAIGADFYSSHPANGENGEKGRYDYAASIALINDYSLLAQPCFPGEAYKPKGAPDAARRMMLRDNIWLSLVSSGAGYLQWHDFAQPIAELTEYKMANDFTKELSWLTKPLAKPAVTLNIGSIADYLGSEQDHEKKKSSPQLAKLIQYETLSLDRGIPIGFSLTTPLSNDASIEELQKGAPGVFHVPQGYQARYLLSADQRNGLIYLRNFAQPDSNTLKYRVPTPCPFTLTTTLSPGRYQFDILDLDRQKSEQVVVQSPGVVLHRDQTASDFAIKFQRVK